MKIQKSVWKILRFVFGLALFGALFFIIDFRELATVFLRLNWWYIFLLFVIGFILTWVSCVKWQLFLRAYGREVSIPTLMRLYTVGYFFNLFLPSFIGGDIARSMELSRCGSSRRDAFVSTFLERFTGLLAMSLLGGTFAVLNVSATRGVKLAIYVVFFGCLFLTGVCFSRQFAEFVFRLVLTFSSRFLPEVVTAKLTHLIERFNEAFVVARKRKILLVKALAWSLVYHTFTVVNTAVTAYAIGWTSVNFVDLFVVVPLILLVGMVPITPSGIGIQEGAFLFFLQRIGASDVDGLAVGLVLRAKVVLIALFGGVLWTFARKRKAGAAMVDTTCEEGSL